MFGMHLHKICNHSCRIQPVIINVNHDIVRVSFKCRDDFFVYFGVGNAEYFNIVGVKVGLDGIWNDFVLGQIYNNQIGFLCLCQYGVKYGR